MSNEAIIERMKNVFNQFEENKISLKELGENINAHGGGLEGLGNEWEELLTSFEGECDYIYQIELPKKHYDSGIILIENLKSFLINKYPELFN